MIWRHGQGAEYRFLNPFTCRFLDAADAAAVLLGMHRRLPPGHPRGWDFSELDKNFVGINADLVPLWKTVSCCGDDDVEADHNEESNEEVEPLDETGSNAVAAAVPQPPTNQQEIDSVRSYLGAVGEYPRRSLVYRMMPWLHIYKDVFIDVDVSLVSLLFPLIYKGYYAGLLPFGVI